MLVKQTFLFIVFALFFSSCAFRRAERFAYANMPVNVLYAKNKGDVKLTGYQFSDAKGENKGFAIQTGYAITKHVAIIAAYKTKNESQKYAYDSTRYSGSLNSIVQTNIFNSSSILYKRNATELAIGYFGKLENKGILTYNMYLGCTFLNNKIQDNGLDSVDNTYNRFHNTKANKYFAQGSIHLMPASTFHLSFGATLSSLHFSSVQTNYQKEELEYFYLDKIGYKSFTFFEPFINLQLSIPPISFIKFDCQLSLANNFQPNLPKAKTLSAAVGATVEIHSLMHFIKKH